MDSTPTAAQSKWLCVPQTIRMLGSGRVEVNEQLEALGPQSAPHCEGSMNLDQTDCNSHIWITEETTFAHRTMVQGVHLKKCPNVYHKKFFNFYLSNVDFGSLCFAQLCHKIWLKTVSKLFLKQFF